MLINKILSAILINSMILYIVAKYIPVSILGFSITPINSLIPEMIVLLWAIFWFINDIIKRIAKVVTLPIRWITLWLFTVVLNVWFFFIFERIVNTYVNSVTVELWSVIQIILLSIVIYILNLFFNKL